MAEIPQVTDAHQIVERIYKAIEKKQRGAFRLARVGASGIGDPCLRSIWYGWRGYGKEDFGGRMLRLFKTGHLQEDRIVVDLIEADYQVWPVDPSTNQQWTYNDFSGHFVVKLDGVIKGLEGAEKTPHVLEIKTHNKKSFDELPKFGVQKAKPSHYDQMHCGMMYSGIHRALYVALCKDDERYYVERVVYDEAYGEELAKKINTIITATMPPAKIADKAEAYACKWCKFKPVCHEGAAPLRTCRSCEHAEAISDGRWMCSLMKNELTSDDQLKACEHYSVIGR
jgi:hypothetical protein